MSLRFRSLRPFRLSPLLLPLLALLPTQTHADPPKLTPANSALYIANVGGGTMLRVNGATGKPLSVLGSGMDPVGLAFGPDKNLYVTAFEDGTIRRFNPSTGASLGVFVSRRAGMVQPITMAFGPDHNLYVAEGGMTGGRIRRYNGRTGIPIGVFVPHGRGGLMYPGDITFGPDGNLYVTNNARNNILRFDGKTGQSLGIFVKAGSGGLQNPQNIAFGPNNDLYVGGPAGVLQFKAKTGKFVRVFAAHGSTLNDVGGLTFGPDGDLYVGDFTQNEVLRYNGRTAAYKGVFVTPSSGLISNRYIVFGPRGAGGTSPAVAAAAAAKRMKALQASAQAAQPPLLAAGTDAPDFTVQDKSGSPLTLSSYKGKVVVLDFWATWCGPCQRSLPHTNEIAKQFVGKDVVVLAVNVWDTKTAFNGWLPKHPEYDAITFALDPTTQHGQDVATRLYKVSGIPTQYVIGKDGKIQTSFVGYGEPTPELANAITHALAVAPVPQAAAAVQPAP